MPDAQPAKRGPGRPKGSKTRGRPKGLPKTGGRKKIPIESKLDEAADAYLLSLIQGEAIDQVGPTGKTFQRPADPKTRLAAAEAWLAKRRPNLTATAVKADIVTEDITNNKPVDKRHVARTVLGILSAAKTEEPEPAPEPPPQPEQLLIGRDKIIEIEATPVSDGGPFTPASRGDESGRPCPRNDSPSLNAASGSLLPGAHQGGEGRVRSSLALDEIRKDNIIDPSRRQPLVLRRPPR